MYDQNSARTAIRTYIQGSKVVRSFARTQNPASGCIHVHAERLFRAMRTPRPIHVHVHVYGMQHARLRNGYYHLLQKYASTILGTRLRHYACYCGRRTWCLRAGLACLSSKDSRLCWKGVCTHPPKPPWLRAWFVLAVQHIRSSPSTPLYMLHYAIMQDKAGH